MSEEPVIIQWMIDTRPLWPGASKTKDLEHAAARALSLLTAPERAAVLRFYHVRDAKLSLASHLLKRHAITRFCRVPWRDAAPVRDDAHSKPVWRDPQGREPLRFNVTHQAGIVALFAVAGYYPGTVDVGVDVVCTSERRGHDLAMITKDGWGQFVDVHSDVFSPREAAYLKAGMLSPSSPVPDKPGPGASAEQVADFKLRCFYALWCLREAYVKMTGEALLAPWLRDLEFRGFRPPGKAAGGPDGLEVGEASEMTIVRGHEIYLRDQRVDDANVCLVALGPDYMIGAAVRTRERPEDGLALRLGAFEHVDMEEVLKAAEGSGGV